MLGGKIGVILYLAAMFLIVNSISTPFIAISTSLPSATPEEKHWLFGLQNTVL